MVTDEHSHPHTVKSTLFLNCEPNVDNKSKINAKKHDICPSILLFSFKPFLGFILGMKLSDII